MYSSTFPVCLYIPTTSASVYFIEIGVDSSSEDLHDDKTSNPHPECLGKLKCVKSFISNEQSNCNLRFRINGRK